MVENKSFLFGIIAIIIGASGLGLGVFSIVNFQVVEGPEGPPGEDGQDGIDGTDGVGALGGLVVGILDPDYGEILSGNVTIRALIYGSINYTISILRNGTEIGMSLLMMWNTKTIADGWWNISIIAIDIGTNNQSQDEVVVYVRNVEEPTNIYYCSSQSEIVDALDTIGTSFGTIVITENITLSSTINIDGGGHYIIQGAGPITLDRNANDETFNISNAKSFAMKDLIIDASDITSTSISGIYVSEGNDNPVNIQNIQINANDTGRGADINSKNVWIQNCFISGFQTGIYLGSTSGNCHILDNSLFDMNVTSGNAFGIHLSISDSNTLTGNTFNNIEANAYVVGIYVVDSDSNIITDNMFNNFKAIINTALGIDLRGEYNIITGNRFDVLTGQNSRGINVPVGHGYNNIYGNVINNILGSGSRIGINLAGDYNVAVGNNLYNCGSGIVNSGTGNVVDHNVVV